jgi:outer membrane protein OmpA-like peptidoglycan-associated protein
MKLTVYILIFVFVLTASSYSQFEFLKRKAQEKIEKSLEKKMEESENPDEEKTDEENKEKKEKGETKTDEVKQEGLQSYSKFDFIAGEKVFFYEDFSQDAIGDFPANWNTNGSGEIVTTNLFPGNWLFSKYQSYCAIWTDKLLNLPENYTIEFDVITTSTDNNNSMDEYYITLLKTKNLNTIDGGSMPGESGFILHVEGYGTPRYRAYYFDKNEDNQLDISGTNDDEKTKQFLNKKYHISIWVQKSRLRLYINQNKVFDLPKAISLTKRFDRFRVEGSCYISNIRIAIGAPDMRSKLITEGKLVTYGIYFDSGKDIVKPESYGTLKEISKVLQENPTVRVKIVGHTDSDGADAANLELSKKRGEAVKNELIKSFGIEASRLESDGLGETKPVAPNDTPANKALNRRVELIKL